MNVNGPDVDTTLKNGNGSCVDLILGSVNGSCADVILGNENGSCVDVILVNGNDPDMDGSRTGWIPPYIDFPRYHPSFLGHLGPFFGTYLLPLIPNVSPVCATAPPPDLSHRITHAPRCLILFGVFDMTPLRGQTVPLLAHAPYSHVFYVLSPAMWIPEKTPQIRFQRGLSNVLQTFSHA